MYCKRHTLDAIKDDRANVRRPDLDEVSAEEFALVAGVVLLVSAEASYGLVVVEVLLSQNDPVHRAAANHASISKPRSPRLRVQRIVLQSLWIKTT